MTHLTTDDALCRHVADWDGGATYEARQERIQVCLRCPLLDPCRTMTADHVERGIPPVDTVQAAISWGVYGRPSGTGQHPDTCKRGHPLDADNSHIRTRGDGTTKRQCLTCRRLQARARRAGRTPDEQWAIEARKEAA